MTTINDLGFEQDSPGWSVGWTAVHWQHTPSFYTWYTQGTQSVRWEIRDFIASHSFYYYQTVNFDSDFALYWDYNILSANSHANIFVKVDSDYLYSVPMIASGEVLGANCSVSGYRGNHVLTIGIIALSASDDPDADAAFDNMRLVSESAHKYVDISTGDDSDTGETWALAYQTVKKGIDNIPEAGWATLHIAEGDYSAQAAIDLDKDLNLLCEDYGGGNVNPPLTVTLPATV